MKNYTDFDMIRDLLKKLAGVNLTFVENSIPALCRYDCILGNSMKKGHFIPASLKERHIYCIRDVFGIQYALTFHRTLEHPLAIIGPFLNAVPNDQFFVSVMSRNHMHPNTKEPLKDYISRLPVISTALIGYLAGVIDSYLHGQETELSLVQLDYTSEITGIGNPFFSDPENQMLMENFENEFPYKELLHHSIRHGNLKEAMTAYDAVVNRIRIQNTNITLSQAQRYSYSLNAICHHASYEGGVPVAVLDFISAKNLEEVDHTTSLASLLEVNNRILFEYASIVQYLHLNHYSRPVQRVIEYIFINLNKEITLGDLASVIKVSPSYLAALFKKETGRSPIAFVIEKKISYACQLLLETPMSIQEIAQYLGYKDASYFSRIFRKEKKLSPQAYRKTPERSA